MQDCPAEVNLNAMVDVTAAPTLPSAHRMTGAWPPSSKVQRLRSGAASFANSLPTRVEPVKVTLRISGDASKWDATIGGSPNTRLTAPTGTPASAKHCTIAAAV